MAVSIETKYQNANQHVDTNIDSTDFTNSARTIIYARPYGGADVFKPIGVVQGWSFTEQRQVEELFELGSDIKYTIPGRTTGSIAITRMLINGRDIVNLLYGKDSAADTTLKSIKEINTPIDIVFQTFHNSTNDSDSDQMHMRRYFSRCWIVARQESITANQVVIAENCTMTYEKIEEYAVSG